MKCGKQQHLSASQPRSLVPSERNTMEVLAKTDKLRPTVTNRTRFIRLSFVIYSGVPGPHPCRWSLSRLGSLFYQSVSYKVRLSSAKKLQFTASFSWVLFRGYKNLNTLLSVDGAARVTTVHDCRVLQLTLAMVCAGKSRPALVCDQ
jgi:hypothetical protein